MSNKLTSNDPIPSKLHEANSLFKAGRYQDALALLDTCSPEDRKVSAYYNIRGVSLSAMNEHAAAAPMFLEAIKIDPLNPLPYTNIGNCLANNLQFDEADKYYDLALTLDENYFEALVGKGVAAFQAMNYTASEDSFLRALKIRPDNIVVLTNLGNCYSVQGRYDEALKILNDVIQRDPNNGLARTNRGLIRLGMRDFSTAWEDYEFRFDSGNFMPKRFSDLPRWKGPTGTNENVLIWAEQGLGDEIMFANIFPDLERLEENFFIECDPRLFRVFSTSFPRLNFIPRKMIRDVSAIQHQIPMASLGGLFRSSLASFPKNSTALRLPCDLQYTKETSEALRALRRNGKPLVGVSWESFALTKNFRGRKSITAEDFEVITSDSRYIFINLQFPNPHKHERGYLQTLPCNVVNIPGIDLKNDVERIAKLVLELDQVITIGNSLAHIACAVGAPTTILLPSVPDWRWGHTERLTLWYPSGNLQRNLEEHSWTQCLAEARRSLEFSLSPDRG